MLLPPFRLYALMGCPHCVEAENFLRNRVAPALTVIANDDPIANAGVKQLTGQEQYPVLCCTFNKEIVVGFKPEDYDRVVKLYHTLAGAGAFGGAIPDSNPSGQQQPISQNPTEAPKVPSGVI